MLKMCTGVRCGEMHSDKFKLCKTCRLDVRERERKRRNGRIQKIIDLCERNMAAGDFGKILNLINDHK